MDVKAYVTVAVVSPTTEVRFRRTHTLESSTGRVLCVESKGIHDPLVVKPTTMPDAMPFCNRCLELDPRFQPAPPVPGAVRVRSGSSMGETKEWA